MPGRGPDVPAPDRRGRSGSAPLSSRSPSDLWRGGWVRSRRRPHSCRDKPDTPEGAASGSACVAGLVHESLNRGRRPCRHRAGGSARPTPLTGTRERHEGSHRSEGSARLGKTGGDRKRGRYGRRPGADGPGGRVHRGLGTPRRWPGIGRRRPSMRPWRHCHWRPRHPISRLCRVAIAMTPDRVRRSCKPRRPADGGGAGQASCRVRPTTTAPPRGRFGPRAGWRWVCSCSSA